MVTCIEAGTCYPQNPIEAFKIFDIQYGAPMTLIMMALIIGGITLAIYARNRSMPMLVILGIYEFAAFGSILTSQYVAPQFHILIYVTIVGFATGVIMLIFRLVKE